MMGKDVNEFLIEKFEVKYDKFHFKRYYSRKDLSIKSIFLEYEGER